MFNVERHISFKSAMNHILVSENNTKIVIQTVQS